MEAPGHGRLVFDVGSAERPFYPKRSHKKSRKGCTNCKARKVKCDEGLPSCRSCFLRQDKCVYAHPAASSRGSSRRQLTFIPSKLSPGTPSESSNTSHSGPASPLSSGNLSDPADAMSISPVQASCNLWMLSPAPQYGATELKLIWNYTVKTFSSFLASEDIQTIAANMYRNQIVNLAFDAPFLMDSILALSCMELSRSDSRFSLTRAYKYHVRGVQGYHKAIREARPETLPAILINALFVACLGSHNFRDPTAKDLYIVDWLCLWRGIGAIVELVGFDAIYNSGLGVVLYRPPIDTEGSASGVPDYLKRMIESIPQTDEDWPSIIAYNAVLKLLGSLYLAIYQGLGPDFDVHIIAWFTFMPRGFANLALQRQPRALIIIAHYVCFLKLLIIQSWWLEGVADRTLADIRNHFAGTVWEPWLRIPNTVDELTDKLEIARVLLEDPTWEFPKREQDEFKKGFIYLNKEDPVTAAAAHLQWEQDKDNEQDLQVDTEISRQMSKFRL